MTIRMHHDGASELGHIVQRDILRISTSHDLIQFLTALHELTDDRDLGKQFSTRHLPQQSAGVRSILWLVLL